MPEIKQYVNLDPTKADELNGLDPRRAGRSVTLEATVDPVKEKVTVTFSIKNGPQNVKNAGATKTKKAKTDANGKARCTLELSDKGGDSFEVSATAGKTATPLALADKYVVWRRLYYQLSRQDALAKGAGRSGQIPEVPALAVAPVATEYAARDHGIELVDDSRQDKITRLVNVFEQGTDNVATGQLGYDAQREPVSLRIVLVDTIAKSATTTIETPVEREAEGYFSLGLRVWVDEMKPLNADWLVAAEWRATGTTGAWQPAGPTDFAISSPGATMARFLFPPAVPQSVASVDLKVTFRQLKSASNGNNMNNLVLVAKATDPKRQQTLIHEIGHALGMVPAKQPTYYEGKGHTGPHCFTDAGKQKDYTNLAGTCVMFGEGHGQRTSQFCAVCDASVRAVTARVERKLW